MSKRNSSAEVLAPVADRVMCLAAIHGGADAVYVGTPGFNARGRTPDLPLADLKELIDECHEYGVRVLLALNILLFERELAELPPYLAELIALGPDAFIVQDLGLARLLRQMAPQMAVHASTQMTVSSPEAIHITADLGMRRYVLSREMSLAEIRATREATEAELEVFVHGALCVSYSGQCLTSESFGGRSANRGQCAQSCRLPYEFWVDDQLMPLAGKRYLFSPKDLCGLDHVRELLEIGVDSLKIEGRLKEPEYVAAASRAYRTAVDGADLTGHKDWMSSTYSRGFFPGWLQGVDHQHLVEAYTSSHLGLELGLVLGKDPKRVQISTGAEVRPGDGLLLLSPTGEEQVGGRAYGVSSGPKSSVWIEWETGLDLSAVQKGWKVYRNDSPTLEKELRRVWTDRENKKKISLSVEAEGRGDGPLVLKARTADGVRVRVVSEFKLQWAQTRPMSEEDLQQELGALGDTPYRLDKLAFRVQEWSFATRKELRELRRQLVEALRTARVEKAIPSVDLGAIQVLAPRNSDAADARLWVLVRHEAQLEALRGLPVAGVVMDFEWGKDYKPGLAQLRAMGHKAGIATLRVFKPGENHHLKLIKQLKPDFALIRNLGALAWLSDAGIEMRGDFSLNAANSHALDYLLNKGLSSLMPAHDLNAAQFADLVRAAGPGGIEAPLHHYMPTFHMEHCPFAAFISEGSSWKDCGKPCEKHRVEARDHKGQRHVLKPDQECRNTLFNGTPQSSARYVQEWMQMGIRDYRLELLDEDVAVARAKVESYLDLLAGRCSSQELFDRVGVLEKFGVAEGQLDAGPKWQDRKKEQRRL